MSEKNLRSALKRKAIDGPSIDSSRKNKSRFNTEDSVINTPSPPAQRHPPTLRRHETPIDEKDFQPNITKPITASVSRRPLQEIDPPGPPNTPETDDKHSVYNRSFTIIDDDHNNPNKENDPSSSKDIVPHWVASRQRVRPPPQSGSPTQPDSSLQSGSPTLSDPPLQSESPPQYGTPRQIESQSSTHSLGGNDHSASLPSGPFNELGAYTPFNAVPSSDVFSSTSSGFQPNIDMPGGGYPSSTPVIPFIRIGNVEQFTTALFHAGRNHWNPSFNFNNHADYNINADQQTDSPVGANQQPTPTLETDQQPNNTVGDYQQPKQTIGDLLQQAAHTLDAEQQAAHTPDALQQTAHTLDAEQQVSPTANDVSGESLRQRFMNLHLRHMELLETEMNNMAPIRTLLRDCCVDDRTEGSDRFERNFPSSYIRFDIAQDKLIALSNNFLKSSDATATPFAL